ncbi:MAG: hypothetical protein NTY60_04245 [Proteobacteria bacterium]|nr:hypothetical protein [Pseudomonadota bacterium]
MWNLVISTIVFFIAAWYLRRYLDEQGIPHSMTRGLLVFVLASLVSWGAGELVDKIHGKDANPVAGADMSQLLKTLDQAQH